MNKALTVEWCPSWKSWAPSELVSSDISKAFVATGQSGAAEFEYYRKRWRCTSCGAEFVTVKPKALGEGDVWTVSAELAKMRAMLNAAQAKPSNGEFAGMACCQVTAGPEAGSFGISRQGIK